MTSCASGRPIGVSSHAPGRGHPFVDAKRYKEGDCFKSCPREGASRGGVCNNTENRKVSSHAPGRGHPAIRCITSHHPLFQVMPPGGGIFTTYFACIWSKVSSHAPGRGHLVVLVPPPTYACFKSCPREGASSKVWRLMKMFSLFQVMPPGGGISREHNKGLIE